MEYDYLLKFLTIGNSGVGKTSIIHRYARNKFSPNFVSTVGIDLIEKRMHWRSCDGYHARSQRVLLQLWDTAGQERFRSLTTAFFRDAMGFIIVFDVTSEFTLVSVRDWLEHLTTHAYSDTPDIILCGNKVDLDSNRVVSMDKAKSLASELGLPYIETSAATGQGVDRAINTLLDLVMARIEGKCQEEVNKKKGLLDSSGRSTCKCIN